MFESSHVLEVPVEFIRARNVTVNDVKRVNHLFMDISKVAEHLRKYEEKLMYH